MTTAPRFDYDHHSVDYADHAEDIHHAARRAGPLVHSGNYGGFYVATDYDTVVTIARDDASFSSRHILDDPVYQGITVPPAPMVFLPIESDPPEFVPYRKLLNPYFSPSAARRLKDTIDQWSTAALDSVIATGSIDFVRDYGNAVSALFTCELLGLPPAEWRELAEPIHERAYTVPRAPANDRAIARFQACVDRVRLIIAERREKPADDLISVLVRSDIDGVPVSDEVVANVCRGLISGGFGTTASLVANILWYLGEHPEDRQRLIDDPGLLPGAIEEFLRYFTPSQALARTVTRDVDLGSCPLRRSDRVLMSWAGANRDPRQFESPDEVIIDRFPNRHVAFGTGLHRCIGSNFARVELSSMVSEVLRRIPDYALATGQARKYPSIGVINGWISLPATFTAGPVVQNRRLP